LLLSRVYPELHRLAARQMAGERAGHTLSATALVHDAWLRLSADASFRPEDRRQFLAVAARRMRQILVDHARRRGASRREGGHLRSDVTLSLLPGDGPAMVDLLALEQALEQLEALDARKARVVELRYFGGLDMVEIAELLDLSRATVQRDWEVARAFLYRALT